MAARTKRAERRTDALSKERIVAAAIEILDTEGEGALTFRALSARLATGSGAIYWHVADKNGLLAAATDDIIGRAMSAAMTEATTGAGAGADPAQTVRAAALGVFDVIDEHPWVGTELSREPWQPAVLRILEAVGRQLESLGVPGQARFDCASALLNYILGLAGQYAAGARLLSRETGRATFLAAVSARWAQLDPGQYVFVREVAAQLPGHDDREQFLAGIDLILAGIAVTWRG